MSICTGQPEMQVGWHVWHAHSFSPFFRAQTDLQEISKYSDYLKMTVYNNLGGTRMETYITSTRNTVYGDMPIEEALEFEYRIMNYRERGYPEDILEAILGHGDYTGVPRTTRMAKALFAVDELTGLITATALVKPSRSVHDVDAAGVRKKMKDKAFARGVSREDVLRGAEELDVPLDEHIAFVIEAMRAESESLGL